MEPSVLVVEDDRSIATLVVKNLEAAGLHCRAVHDGGAALAEFERQPPALVVLDLSLPGMDGLEVARRLRRMGHVAILMLTARESEGDKLLGFEVGADDYLTKPFSTLELVARVRALLRRTQAPSQESMLAIADLRIDPARREVRRGETVIVLTTLEFDVLHFMASRPGRVFSREALMNQVWGTDRVVDDRSIDSLVSRLRRKLEANSDHPAYIQTVWGAGYRFVDSAS